MAALTNHLKTAIIISMWKMLAGFWRGLKRGLGNLFRWLVPGLGVKRWFLVLFAGITLIGVGTAIFLLDIYRNTPETWWLPVISFLSLRFLTRPLRVLIFGGLGIGLILLGVAGINRSLLVPFLRPGQKLVDQVSEYRRRERGPRIVVIGGGHGIATVLRGLREHTNNLTAVVSVADDGGSSGELRKSLGILAPGDLRNCLAALSDDEAMLTQLFQYRFSQETGLGGHSFGNLFISALVEITGSFEHAIAESGRVLSVHGRVLPATLNNVRLVADVRLPHGQEEVRVEGESKIPKASGRVRRVWLEPNDASAFPPVLQAILFAEMIVIGPGSLYTSILPNLLVSDLADAIRASKALKIFIANLTTQPGETAAYTCSDHLQPIEEILGEGVLDVIVCNSWYDSSLGSATHWVKLDDAIARDPRLYQANLVDPQHHMSHDAAKLAQVLIDLLFERTGPLS
jgi:uncharacterized cofD-like protein